METFGRLVGLVVVVAASLFLLIASAFLAGVVAALMVWSFTVGWEIVR